VCLINYGPDVNKLVVILNIVDARRVLVEGPTSNIPRQIMSVLRLALTPISIRIPRNSRAGTLARIYAARKVDARWARTAWAKNLATRETRENMTDLDRFKLRVARKAVSRVARVSFNSARKRVLPAIKKGSIKGKASRKTVIAALKAKAGARAPAAKAGKAGKAAPAKGGKAAAAAPAKGAKPAAAAAPKAAAAAPAKGAAAAKGKAK